MGTQVFLQKEGKGRKDLCGGAAEKSDDIQGWHVSCLIACMNQGPANRIQNPDLVKSGGDEGALIGNIGVFRTISPLCDVGYFLDFSGLRACERLSNFSNVRK